MQRDLAKSGTSFCLECSGLTEIPLMKQQERSLHTSFWCRSSDSSVVTTPLDNRSLRDYREELVLSLTSAQEPAARRDTRRITTGELQTSSSVWVIEYLCDFHMKNIRWTKVVSSIAWAL